MPLELVLTLLLLDLLHCCRLTPADGPLLSTNPPLLEVEDVTDSAGERATFASC
jgi:hypothetical protein